jgi:hypothetical protein
MSPLGTSGPVALQGTETVLGVSRAVSRPLASKHVKVRLYCILLVS